METRSAKQIIEALAKDVKVKDACKKIGRQDWEDLYQELFVILCEVNEEKLIKIESDGYLHFWIVRTLMNNTTATGKFYNKYHVTHVEQEGEKRVAEEEDEDEQIFTRKREIVETVLTELEAKGRSGGAWYKVNLLRMYAEIPNYSEISRLTTIPFVTVKRDLINFRRELALIIDKRI